jgi:hypothetical protein
MPVSSSSARLSEDLAHHSSHSYRGFPDRRLLSHPRRHESSEKRCYNVCDIPGSHRRSRNRVPEDDGRTDTTRRESHTGDGFLRMRNFTDDVFVQVPPPPPSSEGKMMTA